MRNRYFCSLAFLLAFVSTVVDGGIAGLQSFFRENTKLAWNVATNIKPLEVDHACIDMNQFIYSGLRKANDPKAFLSYLFVSIDNAMKVMKPSTSLVLAFDGPAPFAKLQTQRSRRITNPERGLIVPGTDFMKSIEDMMICYVLQRMHRPEFSKISFYISGASAPGEGELKIVEWIHSHVMGKNESVAICGEDSDILVQSMLLSKIPKVRIVQVLIRYFIGYNDIASAVVNFCYF